MYRSKSITCKSQARIFGGNCQWTYRDWSASYYWKNVYGKSKTVSSIPRFLPATKKHVSNVMDAWSQNGKKTMIWSLHEPAPGIKYSGFVWRVTWWILNWRNFYVPIFTCGFKQYGIYLMDPYLRKLPCANAYLWIQTTWPIFDGWAGNIEN